MWCSDDANYIMEEDKRMHTVLEIVIDNKYIIFAIILAVCILGLILKIIRKQIVKLVQKTSKRYADILAINNKYNFHNIKAIYTISKVHNSKAQFDRFNYTKFFEEKIEQKIDFYNNVIKSSFQNAEWVKQYRKELEKASPLTDRVTAKKNKVPYIFYKWFEEKNIKTIVLEPVKEPQVLCKSRYSSPKGQNSYYDERIFCFKELVERYKIVCNRIEKRASKEYQRSLMTSSLRYDIMKRDGFKCVLCGRNADDGVKLHVDHIVPVSKGGRTFPGNLRTLCDSCNFGKSNKYDECGNN